MGIGAWFTFWKQSTTSLRTARPAPRRGRPARSSAILYLESLERRELPSNGPSSALLAVAPTNPAPVTVQISGPGGGPGASLPSGSSGGSGGPSSPSGSSGGPSSASVVTFSSGPGYPVISIGGTGGGGLCVQPQPDPVLPPMSPTPTVTDPTTTSTPTAPIGDVVTLSPGTALM